MAINQNHQFEDLAGIKCAIVEKKIDASRCAFLKTLLEYNGFTVIVVPSPQPVTPQPDPGAIPPGPVPPETFSMGVTNLAFNSINAVFGRQLKTPGGKVVTLAYWQQQEVVPRDDIPYFDD